VVADGFWQREVCLDLAAIAAAVLLLDDVPGCGQVGDDAAGASVGDAYAGRDVTRSDARGRCTAEPGHSWPEDPDFPYFLWTVS
jgi:hypothetical protein